MFPKAARCLRLLALLSLAACGVKPAPNLEGPSGTVALLPLGPPPTCPPGQAAFAGEAECHDLGAACDGGFPLDSTGWGCRTQVAAVPCTGATREAVDAPGCVPIGDCSAPFPPAGATLFVDDDYTAAQLDATHFKSIRAAVIAARSGAVVAIEAGTYAEDIIDPLDPMTLVGRCAEKVRVTGTGGNQVALYLGGTQGVKVSGLTLTNHAGGVMAEAGELELSDCVVENNFSVGVYSRGGSTLKVSRSRISGTKVVLGGELGAGVAVNTGSTLELTDVAVTDNQHRGLAIDSGSTLTATRLFEARGRRKAGLAATEQAAALMVVNGSKLTLTQSALYDNDGVALYLGGSTAVVQNCVLERTHGLLADGDGVGARVGSGSLLSMDGCTVADHPVIGLYVDGATSSAVVLRSTLRGPASLAGVEIGRAVQVTNRATLTGDSLSVARVSQAGVAFQEASHGTLNRVLVTDVREINWPNKTLLFGGFGLLAEDGSQVVGSKLLVEAATLSAYSTSTAATVTLTDVVSRQMRLSTLAQLGCAAQVSEGGILQVTRGLFFSSRTTGLLVKLGGLELIDSRVEGTLANADGSFGHGITVFDKGALRLTNTTLSGNVGIALVADAASAWVQGGLIEKSSVALHVQNGSALSASDSTGTLGTMEVRVSSTTEFKDNQTRVGTGVVALPSL